MTPVAERDGLTALERLRLHVHDHETFPFFPEDAEEILEEYEVALTELQHRRAAEAGSDETTWRDLALQFDGHRIEALALLRYVAASSNVHEATGRIGEIGPFLSKPPLSGEAVLAQRLAASPSSPATGVLVGWPKHASALPWRYVSSGSPSQRVMADWIEDATGGIVVENVGHIDGPAIVAAVNRSALGEQS